MDEKEDTIEPGEDGKHWDPYYRDPSADITLMSTDNVYFKVSSWRLIRVRDMFSVLPPTAEARVKDTIPMPALAKYVRGFLDSFATASTFVLAQWDFDVKKNVLQLADLFDCPTLAGDIILALKSDVGSVPWDTLVLASQRHDIELGKMALKVMWRDKREINLVDEAFFKMLEELSSPWRSELLRLRFKADPSGQGYQFDHRCYECGCNGSGHAPTSGERYRIGRIRLFDWSSLAAEFAPSPPNEEHNRE
ncbi:hypothetical protein P7C73_g1231, partial [Tremellales sp. Uapishka_1]